LANPAVADVRWTQTPALVVRLALLGIVLVTVVLVGRWVSRSALSAQQQLTNLNEALAERNRDLDAFAGRLAHDLRGPLSTVSLASESLATRFPEARPTTARMERSLTQISNLMDELLTLSRLGTMRNATARAEWIAGTLEQRLDPLIAGVGGQLHIDLQPALIACSESLLSQVLWNLAENSVKYRRPDVPPSITIEGREEENRYRILVSDNGMGMSEADARRAFEAFYRGKHSDIAGTGLGLSIVRRIVEATHGTISVESRLGEGTTFTVSIPLANPERAIERSFQSEPVPVT
jgi:two-component system phosphate regulon sensor histidine kinase PhoR